MMAPALRRASDVTPRRTARATPGHGTLLNDSSRARMEFRFRRLHDADTFRGEPSLSRLAIQ